MVNSGKYRFTSGLKKKNNSAIFILSILVYLFTFGSVNEDCSYES